MADKQKLKNYLQQDILSYGSIFSIIGGLFIGIFLAGIYKKDFSYETVVNLLFGLSFIYIGTLYRKKYRKNGEALPKNFFFKSPIGIILLALLLMFGFLSFTN